ncbi:hypothetical protein DVB69_15540 [Sporosarcina sp. BI001-red]|uniref:hypothetical protein n=1 Tax=Sporosarcina sp. BI001-red TaxID=2282866 RepID=UPI000E237A34|nr:hypothetical protein [Sporosarcina sp. BI001-red]REB05176.1 hypothetical protein DVB69_15540 [Sporosarcina sp. BI001-red]
MKKFTLLIVVVALVLVGCIKNFTNPKDSSSKETGSPIQIMSEDMPNDFGFSISFGIGKNNEVNTFTDTVTKDLIEDGTITTDVALTDEEMSEIYEKMKEVNITEPKDFSPEPINGSMCEQSPFEEDEWKITMNGETITHSVSGKHCEPTYDAQHLLELRNFIVSKIRSKKEYIVLPEAKGGYD